MTVIDILKKNWYLSYKFSEDLKYDTIFFKVIEKVKKNYV